MLDRIMTQVRLSQSAVIVQNLLEMHGRGTEVAPIAMQIANKLVQKVYDERPGLFQGKEGIRPHKMSIAAASLAWGVRYMGERHEAQTIMQIALGSVLLEVSGKPHQYALSMCDHALLELSQDIYIAHDAQREALSVSAPLNSFAG